MKFNGSNSDRSLPGRRALKRGALGMCIASIGLLSQLPAAAAARSTAVHPPCTPSIFHPMHTTYTGLHATGRGAQAFGNPSTPVYNPNRRPLTTTVTLTREQSTSMTVNSAVAVQVSDLVSSIQVQTGLSATAGVSIGTQVSIPVTIPSRQYGWVQAEVGKATVVGTVTQTDMICNAVFYRGPISTTVPYARVWLQPFTSTRPRGRIA